MVTTFASIPLDLHNNEDFPDAYSEAMRSQLTKEQSDKLEELLLDDGQVMLTGEFSDVFSSLDASIRKQLESGISYLYSTGKSGDLILGEWIEPSVQGGWNSTIGQYAFIEDFNFITPGGYQKLDKKPSDRTFAILLHVDINQGKKSISVQPKLLEVPGTGFMLMPGMVFVKNLDNTEMIEMLSSRSSDLLIGKAA